MTLNNPKIKTVITNIAAASVIVAMASAAHAGMQVIKTAQANYVYPSDVGAYQETAAYLFCASEGCNVPTRKRPHVPQRVQVQVVAAKPETQPVRPPVKAATPPPTLRETLYFRFDSAKLTEKEVGKIKQLKEKVSSPEGKATITGYTDKIGTQAYNDKLALRRAETVNRHLGYGTKAVVSGKGKCCYADEADNSKNRRVEVVIERLEAKSAVAPEKHPIKTDSKDR
ncbi:MAG TPA: OmpA family protein [Syntrophales bacterium]|nr:OmpA family protein [Syntrophales bacterium]